MKPRQIIGEYFRGWGNFAGSAIYAFLWQVLVFLPLAAARVFFGDQFGGGASPGPLALTSLLVVLAVWVPLVSNKLGMLKFETDGEETEAPRGTEPEVKRLRRIVRAAEDGGCSSSRESERSTGPYVV
ncbi:MAG: hypothetical protein R6X33_11320 [Candidatus Brocadiia bacterium]